MASFLTYADIPVAVRRDLRNHLDTPSSANWEVLAERLNVTPPTIVWIRHKSCPEGYFFELMNQIGPSLPVAHLLSALELIENFSALKILRDALPDMERTLQSYNQRNRRRNEHEVMLSEPDLEKSRFNQEYEPTPSNGLRKIDVLLTNAKDGRRACVQLYDILKSNNIKADVILEKNFADESTVMCYTEQIFQTSRLVVMLVTEDYLVQMEHSTKPLSATSSLSVQAAITRRILQLMQIEVSKTCDCSRFIPVLVGSVRRQCLPLAFRNTLVYCWPNHCKRLIDFISQCD